MKQIGQVRRPKTDRQLCSTPENPYSAMFDIGKLVRPCSTNETVNRQCSAPKGRSSENYKSSMPQAQKLKGRHLRIHSKTALSQCKFSAWPQLISHLVSDLVKCAARANCSVEKRANKFVKCLVTQLHVRSKVFKGLLSFLCASRRLALPAWRPRQDPPLPGKAYLSNQKGPTCLTNSTEQC